MQVVDAYGAVLRSLPKASSEAVEGPHSKTRNSWSLRHDVDHDLFAALRLAQYEAKRGYSATYYLLPTADYWSSSFCTVAAAELQRLGHSVGLHNNTLVQWMKGEVESPYQAFEDQLTRLRSAGIKVLKVSSHGDRVCYEYGFNNAWIFEHYWSDETLVESFARMSAEGVPDPRRAFQIMAPHSRALSRPDGQRVLMGETSLVDQGLLADVTHLIDVTNVSDSGGSWLRGSPELLAEHEGPVSVLLHPEYWVRDERSFSLVLGCARSGTKWLQQMLTQYSDARVTHEYILNNLDSPSGKEHLTSAGLALMDADQVVRPALRAAQSEFDEIKEPWIEINVYLANYLDLLDEEMPRIPTIALFRHPRSVVASLVHRGWFETVLDVHHVSPAVDDWQNMSQFQRVCEYVSHVNNALLDSCQDHLRLEDLVASPQAFQSGLASAGVTSALPSPIELEMRVDPSNAVPYFSADEEKDFDRILGTLCTRLGYFPQGGIDGPLPIQLAKSPPVSSFNRADITPFFDSVAGQAIPLEVDPRKFTRVGILETGIVATNFADKHTHIILGGSSWKTTNPDAGWPASHDSEYVCEVDVRFDSTSPVTLMLLEYDREHTAFPPRRLLRLRQGRQYVMFRCLAKANRFDMAIYASAGVQRLSITDCKLSRYPQDFLPKSPHLLTENSPRFDEVTNAQSKPLSSKEH